MAVPEGAPTLAGRESAEILSWYRLIHSASQALWDLRCRHTCLWGTHRIQPTRALACTGLTIPRGSARLSAYLPRPRPHSRRACAHARACACAHARARARAHAHARARAHARACANARARAISICCVTWWKGSLWHLLLPTLALACIGLKTASSPSLVSALLHSTRAVRGLGVCRHLRPRSTGHFRCTGLTIQEVCSTEHLPATTDPCTRLHWAYNQGRL
jgi:hypothetical protein